MNDSSMEDEEALFDIQINVFRGFLRIHAPPQRGLFLILLPYCNHESPVLL